MNFIKQIGNKLSSLKVSIFYSLNQFFVVLLKVSLNKITAVSLGSSGLGFVGILQSFYLVLTDVVLKRDISEVDAKKIKIHCKQKLETYKIPAKIKFSKKLSFTSRFKRTRTL